MRLSMEDLPEERISLEGIPEACISNVLSFMSPRDACRCAATSRFFWSAWESDALWEAFLPRDHRDMLERAVDPVVGYASKKDLYARLCHPILIDRGRKSFALERGTGRKCVMLSARDLGIIWGDSVQYWKWISVPESRFQEVAELLNVCWLEINGRISTKDLSPGVTYVAYLIFMLTPISSNLHHPPQEATITVGCQSSSVKLCLDPSEAPEHEEVETFVGPRLFRRLEFPIQWATPRRHQPDEVDVKEFPRARSDGWKEITMGEFFNEEGSDGEVEISLKEIKALHWKRGLIVQGIEFRPK